MGKRGRKAGFADERLKDYADEILRLYTVEKLGSKAIATRIQDDAVTHRTVMKFLQRRGVYAPGTIPRRNQVDTDSPEWIAEKEMKRAYKLIQEGYRQDRLAESRTSWRRHPKAASWETMRSYWKNPEAKLIYAREYYKRNTKKKLKQNREWRKNNPERVKELKREWYSVPENRISMTLRTRLSRLLNSESKEVCDLVGCSSKFLKQHIESQFKRGMRWENYGTFWHIDHIIPCAAYDFSDRSQALECFNWQNLRPLKAVENMRKGRKITEPQTRLPFVVK